MNGNRGTLSVIACDSGKAFAERIMAKLRQMAADEDDDINLELKNTRDIKFPNGEFKVVVNENIRGDDLYVVQCMEDPLSDRTINDNLMVLLAAINAGYQSDADHITAVIPQFPYARQERKKDREAITAKLVARTMEIAGAQRVITLDIHAEAIQGFFKDAKLEDLHASNVIIDYIENEMKLDTSNLVVTGPDVGSAEKARHYSKRLKAGLAIVDKARSYDKPGNVESMRLVGDVSGKDVLMVDDMISTGNTLRMAIELLREKGAQKIYVAASLCFFNGECIDYMNEFHANNDLSLVIGTDAVFHGEKFIKETPWYHEISIAPLFANVIYNINKKRSVSELLK
jgi:ribose-phosphate pyrophosphokinase